MTTGELIANIRESRGVLQKDLAKIINIDPVVLNRIEKGKRPARGNELRAIADYFKVSVDYLLGRDSIGCTRNLSTEQETLLKDFDSLDADGRGLLLAVINSLCLSHSKDKNSSNVIQNNSGGRNFLAVNGNQYVV